MKIIPISLALLFSFGVACAEPVKDVSPIPAGQQCGGCKMIVPNYPGPKGEILFKNGDPIYFCSVKCLTCNVLNRGLSDNVRAVVAHNAETADWDHPEDDKFIDLTKAWVVVGSKKKATMGKSVAPFETEEAAKAFAAKFGGNVFKWSELKGEILNCRPPRPGAQPF